MPGRKIAIASQDNTSLHTQHNLTFSKIERMIIVISYVIDVFTYLEAPDTVQELASTTLIWLVLILFLIINPLKKTDHDFQELQKNRIRHFGQSHPLDSFKYRRITENDYSCCWCNKPLSASGISYGSFTCGFFLHELCSVNNMPRRLEHPFHPSHPLYLRYSYYLSFFHAVLNLHSPYMAHATVLMSAILFFIGTVLVDLL